MACFIAPAAVAIVTTVAQRVVKKRETRAAAAGDGEAQTTTGVQVLAGKWSRRLSWLNTMLWGGVVLLCLEHIWHGEVVPWPPFLTAMETPGAVGPMLREIATVGGAMTAVVFVVWGIMIGVAELLERRAKSVDVRMAEQPGAGGA